MKMRMTNKRLAFMVGMALSAGITFGIAPGDVYAADFTIVDGEYYQDGNLITVDGENPVGASDIQEWFKDYIGNEGSVASFGSSGDAVEIAGTDIQSLGKGASITIAGQGGSYSTFIASGEDAAKSLKYENEAWNVTGIDKIVAHVGAGQSENLPISGTVNTLVVSGADATAGSLELRGTFSVENLIVGENGNLQLGNASGTKPAEVTVGSFVLEKGATIWNGDSGHPDGYEGDTPTIKVGTLSIDASDPNMASQVANLNIAKKDSSTPVSVAFTNGAPSEELLAAVKGAVAEGAMEEGALEEAVAEAAKAELTNVAGANPFTTKLPSADEIAKKALDDAGKAKLTEAVREAGKTAAAPGVTSARAAAAITNVLTNNVVNRTAEIRGFASAVDEGRPAPDKMWFQYKHTNMDVDGGDIYSKSTINTNNFQLGYDTQIGTNDYLGAYIGTTTGNADFNGPAQNGRIDIENSFDFVVYGTHMLPNDQYIDYMIHTGKFDSKLNSDVKYGTNDTGAMVGYGAKIAQNDRLTLNPYIQLAYDKISVDSYYAGPNYIKSDDSNNWTAKLGLNLIDASGLYGGVAYSRGLSGSYNAYINGVSMPTNDYNANVLYLSLGYRASMAKNAVLDLSMEKTFMDYKGWTAAGKVNFYF